MLFIYTSVSLPADDPNSIINLSLDFTASCYQTTHLNTDDLRMQYIAHTLVDFFFFSQIFSK